MAGVSGTGFSIDITLTDIPTGNSGIIGINKYCYLTEENLGDLFDYAYAAFSKSEEIENAGGWRQPTSADFKSAGLSVKAIAANSTTPYDITQYISAGVLLSGDDTIILSYGTVLIDGALTDNEGQVLAINPEEGGEATMHDGVADGKIATVWYVEAVSSTVKAIPESDNKAELYFVITPEELNDAKAIASLESNKIKFLTESDILEGGTSEILEVTSPDQVEGGGFKMSIPLNSNSENIVDGYAPALGIQKMFTFTADNIGSERFNALKTAIASLEKKSNGFLAERPLTKVLTNSGIHIFASYPNNATSSTARVAGVNDRDVSGEIDFNLMQSDENSIVMGYGAIIADRALTSNEGGKFEATYETTRITSDGAADYVLTAEWYMTKTDVIDEDDDDDVVPGKAEGPGSSSGGCIVYTCPLMALAALIIFKKR